jgi:hypothetical protein
LFSLSFTYAAIDKHNYVWNGSEWIGWLSTPDGRPRVDFNLLNITAQGICLDDECIYNWDDLNGTGGNTTDEIRNVFTGSNNISYDESTGSFGLNLTCEQITGSPGLCDGEDNVGSGGTSVTEPMTIYFGHAMYRVVDWNISLSEVSVYDFTIIDDGMLFPIGGEIR